MSRRHSPSSLHNGHPRQPAHIHNPLSHALKPTRHTGRAGTAVLRTPDIRGTAAKRMASIANALVTECGPHCRLPLLPELSAADPRNPTNTVNTHTVRKCPNYVLHHTWDHEGHLCPMCPEPMLTGQRPACPARRSSHWTTGPLALGSPAPPDPA